MKRFGMIVLALYTMCHSMSVIAQIPPVVPTYQSKVHCSPNVSPMRQLFTYKPDHFATRAIRKPRKLTHSLPSIDKVYIRGMVDVRIIGGQVRNRLKLLKDHPDIAVEVSGHSIYIHNISSEPGIRANKPTTERPRVKLYVSQIQQLIISGYDSTVTANNIAPDCGFCLSDCGSGCVSLSGVTHVCRITSTGCATIAIPCVCTDELNIVTTGGLITLGGSTNLLAIRSFQNSCVDARCLDTMTALVQAGNTSSVMVRTSEELRAFAGDRSNIYYYTTPQNIISHTYTSGNVLQIW